jgi:hypothetical protein
MAKHYYSCDLSGEPILDPAKGCQFSMGIDIGACYGCPHLVSHIFENIRAKTVTEHDPIPVEDLIPKQEEKEECEQKLLIENPDFLEID